MTQESPQYVFRDSQQTAPAFGIAQSFWALTSLPMPIDSLLEEALATGTRYLEAGLRVERLAEVRRLLNKFPLQLIAQGWASSPAEGRLYLERAAELGAIALNLQLGHAYLDTNECIALVESMHERCELFGIPLLIETHRGCMTQDLYRTAQWLQHCPYTRIALDVSHYLVAGEGFGGHRERFHQCLHSLLQRTAIVHGRISNGQCIQVSVEDPANHELYTATADIWQRAMCHWLANAPADAVFIFEPELGPAPYACHTGFGDELFSRLAATRRLTALAQSLWQDALAATERTPLFQGAALL